MDELDKVSIHTLPTLTTPMTLVDKVLKTGRLRTYYTSNLKVVTGKTVPTSTTLTRGGAQGVTSTGVISPTTKTGVTQGFY